MAIVDKVTIKNKFKNGDIANQSNFEDLIDSSVATTQGTDTNTYNIRATNEGTTPGNARGEYSVDLQTRRTDAAYVASGQYSVIGGGYSNTASGYYSTIGGGYSNYACGGGSTVSGGYSGNACGDGSTVGGGISNCATNYYSTVGGGAENTACGHYSTIGGGSCNCANGCNSTVSGGNCNTASGCYSTVGGGYYNCATGCYSTVGGGYYNFASGHCSTVGGGISNCATNYYSTVGGGYGLANRYGQRSHASGPFSYVAGSAQQIDLIARNVTTNTATPTNVFLDGTETRLTITAGTGLFAIVNIAGIKSDGSSVAHYIRKVAITNISDTTTLLSSTTIGTDYKTDGDYDVAITADDTNNALDIKVTGKAAETLRWVTHVQGVEIIYGT